MSRHDSTGSCPLNSNRPCYLPEGLLVYCSIDFIINPSAPPPDATTRYLDCKDKFTLLNNGMSVGYVTTKTGLPLRESDKADTMGEAAFIHAQRLTETQAPGISGSRREPPTCPPCLSSNPSSFTPESSVSLNSQTYPGIPLLNTFCGSQSHGHVWNATGDSLPLRPCVTQFLSTFV